MQRNRRLVALAMGMGLWAVAGTANGQDTPHISASDLLRFAEVGDPIFLDWHDVGDPLLATYSPDRSRIAVLVSGGDPDRVANTGTLLTLTSDGLFSDPQPRELVRFASTGSARPIGFIRWLRDSRTIVFAGARDDGPSQLYRVDTNTGELQQLSQLTEQITYFDVAAQGNRIVYLVQPSRRSPADDLHCIAHGCLVTARTLRDAQDGGASRVMAGYALDLPSGAVRRLAAPEEEDPTLDFCDFNIHGSVSPNGRFAIRLCRLQERYLPRWWGDYTMNTDLALCLSGRNARCWRRGYVVDLDDGRSRAWTNAPSLPFFHTSPPIWIDGGRQAIIPAAYEPLDGRGSGQTRALRAQALVVQLLDPANRTTRRIGRLDPRVAYVSSAIWDDETQILTIEGRDSANVVLPIVRFQRRGRNWAQVAFEPSPVSLVRFAVEQSANDRPVLVAIDDTTGQRSVILDPNPWLERRSIGTVETIEWSSTDGRTWAGGLYLPPRYQEGTRYPLVIQTHGFEPERFSLHGAAKNFPGQALAAQGMLVLQVAENLRGVEGTPDEMEAARLGYEAAISHLAERGLIDRDRVGMIGWSATGPTVAYMMTHSEYPIAAVAFTHTAPYGWWYYLSLGGSREIEGRFGSEPFQEGFERWLEGSPALNLARVRAPLLMFGAGQAGVWDWYAGLRRLERPIEFVYQPRGTHDVYRPGQRLAQNQALVDWFRFWLKDEEDGDPARADQYARWRLLRDQQRLVMQQPRPPLLEWSARPVASQDEQE